MSYFSDYQTTKKQTDFPTNPDESRHSSTAHSKEAKTDAPHILIVDDDEVNIRVISNFLDLEGYRTTEAKDGYQALELIEAAHTFDLILLDIMMPGVSGIQVCQRIRLHWALDELPILFLTARTARNDLVRGFEAGCNDYLMKPVRKSELIVRVKTHLKLLDHRRLIEEEKMWLAKDVELERVKSAKHLAELRLLHSQMNPHFLQNTLNSISFFCLEEPEKAIDTLNQLSLLLRANVKMAPEGGWLFHEELAAIRAFVKIQKVRFEQRLVFEEQISGGIDTLYLPSFMVQPLVENAIIHGLKQSNQNITVVLTAKLESNRFFISVSNPGERLQGQLQDILKPDHALGNIDKRLQVMFDTRLEYEYKNGEHHFSFSIPLKTDGSVESRVPFSEEEE